MNVGDIKEHKTVNAKTGETTYYTTTVTQEEVDEYNAQLEADRIKTIQDELKQLDEVVPRVEEETNNTFEALKAELIAEIKAKLNVDIELNTAMFTNEAKKQAKARKQELRNQL